MNNTLNISSISRRYYLSTFIGILLSGALLSCSFRISGQTGPDSDPLVQSMKHHYQEWLSKRPVTDLLVEYDPSPMAMDIANPRFTWIVDLEGKGRKQTGYQVLVASSIDKLDADQGDMWNPGFVDSDQSSQLTYQGLPLESNREYFWKVRIRDEDGEVQPYSKTGKFNTGYLSEEDWTADWIGKGEPDELVSEIEAFVLKTVTEEVQNVNHEPRSPLFRHEFDIDKKVRRARLFIAGLGFYEIRLNGAKLGNYVLATSKTDYRQRILYDTYDVSSELNEGINAIGIMLGNGWFNGQKKYWGWQMQWFGSPRAMIFEIEVPANTSATVYLPASRGSVVYERGKPVHKVEGISILESDGEKAIFELGSGSYKFMVSEKAKRK